MALPAGLEEIEEQAFCECGLESFVAPAGLRLLAHGAFADCKRLERVELNEGLEVLGRPGAAGVGVFAGARMNRLRLPSTLRKIESGALQYCGSVPDLFLPDGLAKIGRSCFGGSRVFRVRLPASLEEIGESEADFCACFGRVFVDADCPLAGRLRARKNVVVVPSGTSRADLPETLKFAEDVRLPAGARVLEPGMLCVEGLGRVDVSDGVCGLGARCFAESYVERVRLASSVREVGAEAFYGCRNLAEVELNEGLAVVRGFAFAYSALEAADVPGSVRFLGTGAFAYCAGLRWLALGPGLREICPCCFEGTGVREVQVPASVRVIGERAFYRCATLRTLGFEARSRLRRVEARAFGGTALGRAGVSFPRRARVDADAFFE